MESPATPYAEDCGVQLSCLSWTACLGLPAASSHENKTKIQFYLVICVFDSLLSLAKSKLILLGNLP
jgi:hypothetical protein